jgi:SAM-dependent methyltransferase
MHPTAMSNCAAFFRCYGPILQAGTAPTVLDIGAQDVNGSLRSVVPEGFGYVGVDFVAGKGVDVILHDPYSLPFETGSADVILSSSCFEHSEMFWVLFLEILRVLKPGGLFYLNVPSNGDFHRWPVDCWRFYPDSGRALVAWALRCKVDVALLESYTSTQNGDQWNDFVAVFVKDSPQAARYPGRIIDGQVEFNNGLVLGNDQLRNHSVMPEDKRKLTVIGHIIADRIKAT